MSADQKYFQLFEGWLSHTLTKEQEKELLQWIHQLPDGETWDTLMSMAWDKGDVIPLGKEDIDILVKHALRQEIPEVPVRRMYFRKWSWAAAAIALALLSTGAYLWTVNKKSPPIQIAEIQPGKEGAILTLADGTRVSLDTVRNGVISLQGGATVKAVNGTLLYDGTGNQVVYNTMTIPKGRQFQVTLPDGTQVWLNSASSIRYPTVFSGEERRVEVRGEAYFEVTKNAKMPFRVNVSNKAEVEVLGTHFNVNAYENEGSINTTLLEGSVRVAAAQLNKNVVLKPGQQAQLKNGKDEMKVVNADIDKVIAWKNGLFNFEDAHLEEVMRQLERWYDINVVYEKGVPDIAFGGEITKGVSLNGVLVLLERAGVHFRLEGRTVVILPSSTGKN